MANTYTTTSKLGTLAQTLKDHNFKLYEEEMDLRNAMGKHDAVLINLTRRTSETMFDLYESDTTLKIMAPSRMYGELPHYCSLMAIPNNDHQGNPAIYLSQDSVMLLAHYGINDFENAIKHHNASEVKRGTKVLVFVHEGNEYFGFEGYVGRPSYQAFDMCDILPTIEK